MAMQRWVSSIVLGAVAMGCGHASAVRLASRGGEIALHGPVVPAMDEGLPLMVEHCGGPVRLVDADDLEREIAEGGGPASAVLGAPAAGSGTRIYFVCRDGRERSIAAGSSSTPGT